METVDCLSYRPTCCRRGFRVFDTGQHGNIQESESTSAISAGMAVSHCVDNIICTHGGGFLSCPHIWQPAQKNSYSLECVRYSTGCKFFLVNFFLQPWCISVFFYLACILMAAYLGYPDFVLSYFKNSWILADSLFVMGYFCRLSELRHLSFELSGQI